ncbi:MAG: PaaI family thioesterase [Sciscionella sp.]
MSRQITAWPPVETELPKRHPEAPPAGTELGPHYVKCFGCGDQVNNGLRLHTTLGDGLVAHTKFTVTEGHQGAPGLAHGGALSAAFDEALGTLNVLTRQPAVTGKLETEFLRPVPVGSTLYITARIDGVAGRKIYNSAQGRLDGNDGPIAVRARALFVVVGLDHFTKYGAFEDLASMGSRGVTQDYEVNP